MNQYKITVSLPDAIRNGKRTFKHWFTAGNITDELQAHDVYAAMVEKFPACKVMLCREETRGTILLESVV